MAADSFRSDKQVPWHPISGCDLLASRIKEHFQLRPTRGRALFSLVVNPIFGFKVLLPSLRCFASHGLALAHALAALPVAAHALAKAVFRACRAQGSSEQRPNPPTGLVAETMGFY